MNAIAFFPNAPDTPITVASEADERYTPPHIAVAARQMLGQIDLDPASCEIANHTIGATEYYDLRLGGLDQRWYGRVWLNPPYSLPRPWIERLILEYERGQVDAALLLLNTATGTAGQQRLLRGYPCCLLAGRLDFLRPDGSTEGRNRYEQILFYFGHDIDRFINVFRHFGAILLPAEPVQAALQERML